MKTHSYFPCEELPLARIFHKGRRSLRLPVKYVGPEPTFGKF